MKYKRIFVIVMDSVGCGYDSRSKEFNDEGANTLLHISEKMNGLNIPTLNSLGILRPFIFSDICNKVFAPSSLNSFE